LSVVTVKVDYQLGKPLIRKFLFIDLAFDVHFNFMPAIVASRAYGERATHGGGTISTGVS
jgi:hypothetical protein